VYAATLEGSMIHQVEMPCTCPGCEEVWELNDLRRDPLDPTGRELVCPPCAVKRQREADEVSDD
jgi:hypothetical protein